MASLTYGVRLGTRKSRSKLVSFSVKSRSGLPSTESQRSPRDSCSASITPAPLAASRGRGLPAAQDQVLRNHRVGSRWQSAASGPRLVTLTRIRMSSTSHLAYSTTISK